MINQNCMIVTGLQIKQTGTASGIHIPFNKNGKASGEAYLQFETAEDMNEALKRNMGKLGHRFVDLPLLCHCF